MMERLSALGPATWLRAFPIALVAAVVIAIPTSLIETGIFYRPIPPRALDYVILAVTAALIGLIFAIRPDVSGESVSQEARTLGGGFVSLLAVGCPVCNHLVVALVGTSGALSWWAPVQPVVGVLAIVLLGWTLRMRLRTYNLTSCPL